MELHPLPTLPQLRAQGDVRAIVHPRPRTIGEILADARQAMEMEDAYVAWLEGKPLPPRIRRPRKTLRAWLFGHPTPPLPPNAGISEIVPLWPDTDSDTALHYGT